MTTSYFQSTGLIFLHKKPFKQTTSGPSLTATLDSTQIVPASSTPIVSSNSNSGAAPESSPSVPVGGSSSIDVSVLSTSVSVDVTSPISQTASTTLLPVSSSVPVEIPTTIIIPSSPASLTATFSPVPTTNLCGPSGGGSSCDGSPFGACCGSEDTCGTDAAHCGIGCQPDYGFCTNVSNDGTCGNGVSCAGNQFGDCCSQFFFCGNSTEYCDAGCQPELGRCNASPSSTVVLLPSSTQVIPSATPSVDPCGVTYDIDEIPPNIGNGTLTSIPAPAVFQYNGVTYSFGFIGTSTGSKAYAETNPTTPATDRIAYYQIPLSILPPTSSCSNFGYFYHVESRLCVTANATSNAPNVPTFAGSELLLEPCGLCAGRPDINQLFCTNGLLGVGERDRPYPCMEFYGDVQPPLPFYETSYGPGPALEVATVELGPGNCIWLLFP
ncbi:carbohydrate-binding module family 18 protein [Cadophora sp. DSE1049]|nr:carbohydrate-binding module family 18 protein [Cadophora sp. DSE1049]